MFNKKQYMIKRYTISTVGFIAKLLLAFIFIFPFYWMIVSSFKPYLEAIRFPPTLIPETFTIEAYVSAIKMLDVFTMFKNSFIIMVSIVVLQLLVSVPAAYALAKYKFKGKNLVFGLVIVGFMVPTVITFIPIYLMFAKMKMLNSLLPQIIPFGAHAFGIFLLRQNFMQISDELLESARLDNASEVRIMTKIMLPMSLPTIVTAALFSFISHWNAYFWPMVMVRSEKYYPVTLGINRLKDVEFLDWPLIMAGNTMLVLPILLLFLLASKRIISAMAYKGIK